MQISETMEEAMDLWNATLATGYEPYTDEFDVVMDVEQLVPVERVKRIASFIEEYGGAGIERLELPEHDPVEYMIASQREEHSISADAADIEDNADSPEKSGPGL